MEFNIKKNGTLPLLKMQVVDDGRGEFDSFMSFIETSSLYFSMMDVETGSYKIHLEPAGFVEKTQIDPNAKTEYYIYYKFPKKYTNKVGRYEGEFVLKNQDGTLILPIREKLYINILESNVSEEFGDTFNLLLNAEISSGSTIIRYTLTSSVPVFYNTTVNFTHTFGTITGSSLVITTGVTINSLQKFGSVTLTLTGTNYSNLTQVNNFSNIQVSPIGLVSSVNITEKVTFDNPGPTPTQTPTPTPTPTITSSQVPVQVIEDAIITDNVEYINVGEGFYLKYINPSPLPTPSFTPTPTQTPSQTPTNTPTPTETPSETPTNTPTPTPSETPAPLVPLTLYIQPMSGGQAIIFDGVTYTSETTVNIVKNTSYNIEAVPIPGFVFAGWNIYGGSFSSTGQSTTVSVSFDSGANLAPSYSEDPNFDALAYQLTTSLSSYQNATDNDWVIITQEEYNNIFGNVDGVIKIGNNDEQVNTRDVATGYDTTTFGTVDANTPLTIPTGYYVVGFVAESWNQNGQVQLGYTTTFHEGAPTYMGNSPNVIGGMTMFYVRKRPSNVEGAPASTDLYPVLNFLPPAYPNAVFNTFGWYTLDNGANWAETVSASQTAKIQILLTNVKTWPSAPIPSSTPTPTPTPTITVTPSQTPNVGPLPFISRWTANPTIELPLSPTGTYSGTIDWGDGNTSDLIYDNREHTYAFSGDYTVTITGQIEGWDFLNYAYTYRPNIKEIMQWGTLRGENNSNAYLFIGCNNLVLTGVTDTLNLSGITSLNNMFSSCSSITTISNMNNWDVSSVTDMSEMFSYATMFNQNIGNWDVSNVTDMSGMFGNTTQFNQNIGNWNVSSVTNMSNMFNTTNAFNQDISNWNVSGATNMDNMFFGAFVFNQDLSTWCLPLIPSEPTGFSTATSFWTLPKPFWGGITISVNSLWNGATSINTNLLQLTQTTETLLIRVDDTITDDLGSTSVVGSVTSDGTYTYVGTGPGGTIAFDCQFPLTFTGPC